ncbi:MAG TPA: class I SAM-dependent methyltransferase [Polyangiaceae bacterium LLY-WYZ-15_(1-7)]|nr:class I SAM-dependent methyltransferase [Polyangiaceae bacterium LLY-WYZ-15_(1-7)]HJL07522.1 class I SAM-dependent methyltransferase [Polyangiaceae bacterium LLY-WYZ-15_(1-7)]HJL21082.1 class I SAM-dependent methyltransferase [Polyangiaceae bacterium LLY-WYZ-15_(1-7)]HJL37168.1 class I SAM-dependent methyltransferase [Polyangiaceae bacterium LLY-WYZ-15_(1-7)]
MTERAEAIFFELFEGLPRQGPGSAACTERAFGLCQDLPSAPRVLDLGCGAGAQTLDLVRLGAGSVVAVDGHAPLVARLRERVVELGLEGRVEARVGDMAALERPPLDLAPESFDLVWSEGALYNLGLPAALAVCRRMSKPGGCLAFSEAVWHSADPPEEVREVFAEYPGMGTEQDVRALLEREGWDTLGSFGLSDAAWWDEFYAPMEARLEEMRERYAGDAEALEILRELAREPAMHRRHGATYGYTFFIARRP